VEDVVSRRRKMKVFAKRTRDAEAKRLQLVCTGAGRHGVVVLDGYWREIAPGRRDRALMVNRDPGAVVVGDLRGFVEDGVVRRRLPGCGMCGLRARELDDAGWHHLLVVLGRAAPGTVLRYDVSTGRLLLR
jgi:hypothetical protein